MRRIVHAADIQADIDADPIARGLEAIAVGHGVAVGAPSTTT
jgi:hypothetical protein